jgi:HPt (histidine-containing phosphotransfer) domain-containing protein
MSETILQAGEVTVDISMLYDIAANDEGYIKKMVNTFLDNLPVTREKINAHFRDQDWDGLYKAAHYAKSSLSIIKINDLYAVAQAIETNAKYRQQLDELPTLISDLNSQSTIAEQLLRNHFTSNT